MIREVLEIAQFSDHFTWQQHWVLLIFRVEPARKLLELALEKAKKAQNIPGKAREAVPERVNIWARRKLNIDRRTAG